MRISLPWIIMRAIMALITIEGGDQFLLVPEGKEAPEGLDEDITVIHQPLENIYLVATSTMDFFRALDDFFFQIVCGEIYGSYFPIDAERIILYFPYQREIRIIHNPHFASVY